MPDTPALDLSCLATHLPYLRASLANEPLDLNLLSQDLVRGTEACLASPPTPLHQAVVVF
jgi:hypothetical protein